MDFFRRVYETREAGQFKLYYQAGGLDNFFHLAARRSSKRLMVSFTDASDQNRSAAEQTLRASQAAEQAARAKAELERAFEHTPMAIAVYRGPCYTIELANLTVAFFWRRTREQLIGKGLFEALPEVAGMGYKQLLGEVMTTGVPHVAHAMEAQYDRNRQRETILRFCLRAHVCR